MAAIRYIYGHSLSALFAKYAMDSSVFASVPSKSKIHALYKLSPYHKNENTHTIINIFTVFCKFFYD